MGNPCLPARQNLSAYIPVRESCFSALCYSHRSRTRAPRERGMSRLPLPEQTITILCGSRGSFFCDHKLCVTGVGEVVIQKGGEENA